VSRVYNINVQYIKVVKPDGGPGCVRIDKEADKNHKKQSV